MLLLLLLLEGAANAVIMKTPSMFMTKVVNANYAGLGNQQPHIYVVMGVVDEGHEQHVQHAECTHYPCALLCVRRLHSCASTVYHHNNFQTRIQPDLTVVSSAARAEANVMEPALSTWCA